jgi:dihydrofolate reductase
MSKLQVAEFLTLDGVMEAPDQWNGPFMNEEIGMEIGGNLFQCDALLYGRQTYEEMAAAWPERTGDMADRFNNVPKFVVSTILQEATWNNSRLIKGNIAEEVSRLKQQFSRAITILGSGDLVRTLISIALSMSTCSSSARSCWASASGSFKTQAERRCS